MYRYSFFVVFILLVFSGCVQQQPKKDYHPFSNQTELNSTADEATDLLILKALFAVQEHDFENAAILYKELYENYGDKAYLINAIKLSLAQNNTTISSNLTREGYEKYPDDNNMKRFYVAQLIKENDLSGAQKIIEDLLIIEKSEQNYKLLGAIFTFQNNFENALKLYEEAYKIDKSEQTLMQIADLNIRLGKLNVAISLLETYTRINGCTPNICSRLISIYAANQNIDGLLWVYLQAYEAFKDEESAQKIVELYMYKNDTKNAILFLEKTKQNPVLLIDLYAYQKEFKKAKELSYKMYQETEDINYLAKTAIYTYEGSKDKKSVVDEVAKNFEIVVANSDDPLYLNYYGYLLIDHDVDISKGIELVKKALLKEPDSYYYLDSLAWGYYKLNQCKEALEVMDKFIEQNKDEDEIKKHYDLIKKCAKTSKK